ncbi:MAG: lysophospholipase, partial [Candidatus Heimdallarchaeota archaeon]|nr:lysophospholipase [Candidatus Heimdallarchaeota archaeon]
PDLPFHLLGHSMGSIIANNYMKMYADQSKFKSIILSGTGSAPGPDINGVTLFMSKIFSFIFPKLILPSNLDPNFISYDDEVVNAYKSDPLVKYDKISARLGAEMFKFLGKMREAANGISIPVLIQFGSEDQAFHPDSRIPLKEAFSSKSVDFKMYEGFRHEVYNELKKEQPLGDLKDWINKHN